MSDVHAESSQLGVVTRHLLEACLDVTDVSDLRSEVKVNQPEDIETTLGLEAIDELHQLRRAESDLRLLATAFRPPAGPFGVELDADARRRSDPELVGDLEHDVHLAQLLENDEHLMPQLLTHQRETHELFVLVAVAHDHVIRVLGESKHGLQLRFASALEPDASDFPDLDYLLDHVALLIHFDRVDRGVSALIGKLSARPRELLVQRLDSGAQDIRKAQQRREPDALLFQIVRQLE